MAASFPTLLLKTVNWCTNRVFHIRRLMPLSKSPKVLYLQNTTTRFPRRLRLWPNKSPTAKSLLCQSWACSHIAVEYQSSIRSLPSVYVTESSPILCLSYFLIEVRRVTWGHKSLSKSWSQSLSVPKYNRKHASTVNHYSLTQSSLTFKSIRSLHLKPCKRVLMTEFKISK